MIRIAIVYTYPLYHDSKPIEEWWKQPNREQLLATMMIDRGLHVEIWAVGNHTETRSMQSPKKNQYQVKIFKSNKKGKKAKYHHSDSLVEYAKQHSADFYILKGVDGGIGIHLLKQFIRKEKRPFAFIIGGKCYSRFTSYADVIFYESSSQKKKLMTSGLSFWRRTIFEEKLIRLPKWVDTEIFYPEYGKSKRWDIIVVSRLIPYYKNFSALGPLSKHFRIAVIGDGSYASKLHSLYPNVEWLGYIPNRDLPKYLNQAYLFMHTSLRDYYPKVIVEALACGIPCVAFADAIKPDVLPLDCGLLVSQHDFINPIKNLLNNKNRLERMAQRAREHVLLNTGENVFIKPLDIFLKHLKSMINV